MAAAATRAKTALVLSGGGVYGAYQAGAWRALEDVFSPDAVVGASIGALNGWMIAGGAPAKELCAKWLDLERLSRFRLHLPDHPFDGFLESSGVIAEIEHIHAGWRPRCEIGIATVEWPGFRRRLWRDEAAGARHLAASCALPLVLPAQKLEGRYSFDGGLLGALPLWGALEMGATDILAINVWTHLPWWWREGFRLLLGGRLRRPAPPAGVRLGVLTPSRRLGPLRSAFRWKAANVREWIELGERDALRLRANRTFPFENVLSDNSRVWHPTASSE